MASNSTSHKRSKVEVSDFRISDILYMTNVTQEECPEAISYYFTLVPPATAWRSKQTHTGVMPISNGENLFDILVGIDVLEFDGYDTPTKQKDHTKLEEFLRNVLLHGGGWRAWLHQKFDTEMQCKDICITTYLVSSQWYQGGEEKGRPRSN